MAERLRLHDCVSQRFHDGRVCITGGDITMSHFLSKQSCFNRMGVRERSRQKMMKCRDRQRTKHVINVNQLKRLNAFCAQLKAPINQSTQCVCFYTRERCIAESMSAQWPLWWCHLIVASDRLTIVLVCNSIGSQLIGLYVQKGSNNNVSGA